jgi:hypothetical protein
MKGPSAMSSQVKKPLLMIVSDEEYMKLKAEAAPIFFDRNTHVVRHSHVNNSDFPKQVKLSQRRPGVVLLKNPYAEDSYVVAEDARLDFSLAKFRLLVRICQALGAKKVTVKSAFTHESDRNTELDAEGGSTEAGSIGLKMKKSFQERLQSQFESISEFVGASPNPGEAWKIIEESNLECDPDLIYFIKVRSYNQNLSKSEDVSISLAREADSILSLAAKVSIPAYLKLDIGFKYSLREKLDCKIKLEVLFE